MENKIPLSQFINEQITFFNLEDTKKNFNKLKMKFKRELVNLGKWENAEVRLIGRKQTKVFSQDDLKKLSRSVTDYLIKRANWNEEAIKRAEEESLNELKRLSESFIDDEAKMMIESKQLLQKKIGPLKVTREEELYVMTKALFELFFTPINVQAWNKDREIVYRANPLSKEDKTDIKFLTATERLKRPELYFEKKTHETSNRLK